MAFSVFSVRCATPMFCLGFNFFCRFAAFNPKQNSWGSVLMEPWREGSYEQQPSHRPLGLSALIHRRSTLSPFSLVQTLLVGSQLACRVPFVTHGLAHLSCSVLRGWNAAYVCLESRPHTVLQVSEHTLCLFGTTSARSLHLPSVLRFSGSCLGT